MVNAINWILQKTLQVDGLKIQNYLYKMYFRLNSDSLQDKLKNYKAWILEAILTHVSALFACKWLQRILCALLPSSGLFGHEQLIWQMEI